MNSVYKHIVEISAKINEEQDEIIMQTIQHIGGTEFREITIDRNKVIEALTDYMKKQENKADFAEVVRCKNCKHFYADTYHGKVLRMECRLRSLGGGIGTVSLKSGNGFCSEGERKADD